jgi:peptidoglycan/xylan/chitin deacetylase (PgdA/CDA1 family)
MQNIVQVIRGPISALARRVLGTIKGVSTSHPVVALTFDDGPHPDFTPKILKILERYKARATFFMLGKYAQKYPEIVKNVARGGHAIGNHSWDHPSFPLISSRERRRQLRSCKRALAPYGLRIFRPPFGHQNLSSRLDAFLLGYQVIGWDIDAVDWRDDDAHWIVARVGQKTKAGSIVLFHDALYGVLEERYESREQTIEAVNMFLDNLGDRFRFVTVPELLQHGQPHRVNWYSQGQSEFMNRLREAGGKPWRCIR